MNLLVISNYYPPYYIGGYEIGCQEAVNGLKMRGHNVTVLTSDHKIKSRKYEISDEKNVYRWLKFSRTAKQSKREIFLDLLLIEIWNHMTLQWVLLRHKPDLVYIWNLADISSSLIFMLQKMKISISYFVFDFWLSNWKKDRWHVFLNTSSLTIKGKIRDVMIRPFLWLTGYNSDKNSLRIGSNVQFASQHLKEHALETDPELENSIIIPWGLSLKNYPYKKPSDSPSKLLYAGQIIQHKGVHTAIEALNILVNDRHLSSITLSLVGDIMDVSYGKLLEDLISSFELEKNVIFAGFYNRKELLSIYQEHDILIFPSTWNEPFGITLLESMALGLPIVSTANGGSKEILWNEANSLIFSTENSQECAFQIQRLIKDPYLFENIRRTARKHVEDHYCLDSTIDKIEESLFKIIQKS